MKLYSSRRIKDTRELSHGRGSGVGNLRKLTYESRFVKQRHRQTKLEQAPAYLYESCYNMRLSQKKSGVLINNNVATMEPV